MTYHVFIVDNQEYTSIRDFYVESPQSSADVMKAVMVQTIVERELEKTDIQHIALNQNDVYIQLGYYHIEVYVRQEESLIKTIDTKYFEIGNSIKDGALLESSDKGVDNLFKTIERTNDKTVLKENFLRR